MRKSRRIPDSIHRNISAIYSTIDTMNLTYKTKNGKKIYDIPDKLCEKMLKQADKALKNCYPEAGKGFAVTLLTKKGNIYEGASYGSDTQTLTMHSEAVALAHAALHGEKDVVAMTGQDQIAIYASNYSTKVDSSQGLMW